MTEIHPRHAVFRLIFEYFTEGERCALGLLCNIPGWAPKEAAQIGLIAASENNWVGCIDVFRKRNPGLDYHKALLAAIEYGSLDAVRRLAGPYKDAYGGVLEHAAKCGQTAVAKLAIARGASGITHAQSIAATNGHLETLRVLSQYIAPRTAAAMAAAGAGQLDCLRFVLDANKGAELSRSLIADEAAMSRHYDCVGLAIEHGADPNRVLERSAQRGDVVAIALAVEHGADYADYTTLFRALQIGLDALALVVDKATPETRQSVLAEALRRGAFDPRCIEILTSGS